LRRLSTAPAGKLTRPGTTASDVPPLEVVDQLDPSESRRQARDRAIDWFVELQGATSRWGPGRLPVPAHLLHDAHHPAEQLLGCRVDGLEGRPWGPHDEVGVTWSA